MTTTRAPNPPSKSGKVDEAVKESFPASDAPASGLPDTPPANADEKWAAAKRRKKAAPLSPPIKVPNPPEGEVDDARIPDEIPKTGSRDAPGG
jgi:hypothetical protein